MKSHGNSKTRTNTNQKKQKVTDTEAKDRKIPKIIDHKQCEQEILKLIRKRKDNNESILEIIQSSDSFGLIIENLRLHDPFDEKKLFRKIISFISEININEINTFQKIDLSHIFYNGEDFIFGKKFKYILSEDGESNGEEMLTFLKNISCGTINSINSALKLLEDKQFKNIDNEKVNQLKSYLICEKDRIQKKMTTSLQT